jgi:hypothetical protein
MQLSLGLQRLILFVTLVLHAMISHCERFTLEMKCTLNARSKKIICKDSSLSLHYQQQNLMKVTCITTDIFYVSATTVVGYGYQTA